MSCWNFSMDGIRVNIEGKVSKNCATCLGFHPAPFGKGCRYLETIPEQDEETSMAAQNGKPGPGGEVSPSPKKSPLPSRKEHLAKLIEKEETKKTLLEDKRKEMELEHQLAVLRVANKDIERDMDEASQFVYNKVRSPSRNQRYLGIDIDSVKMCLSLPEDKMKKLHEELAFFTGRRKATKRQLQRLCGILAHCAQLVRGGRTFSRRIIELLSKFSPSRRYISLTLSFQMDLDWWKVFSGTFNGQARIVDTSMWGTASIATDASGTGYGAVNEEDWLCGCWSGEIKTQDVTADHITEVQDDVIPSNINVQELYPILQSVKRWGENWRNCRVNCYTDNTQVVAAVNAGTSVNLFSLELLRQIFWECVRVNCHLVAIYLPGPSNTWPDFLSRISLSNVSVIPRHLCCRGGQLVRSIGSQSRGV